jgi:hypothetical protein
VGRVTCAQKLSSCKPGSPMPLIVNKKTEFDHNFITQHPSQEIVAAEDNTSSGVLFIE